MFKSHKPLVAPVCAAAVVGLFGSSAVFASTGNFTSPLTSNVVLSVDINGGIIASNNSTTEGSNGPSGSPVLSADPYGVTWSPWGGPTSTNGDGTQLPNSSASPTNAASSISKTFGAIGATLSEAGTASDYPMVSGIESMNGRDRGSPSGAAGDSDMFRDFEFAGTNSNVQSTNYLQLSLTGLTPSTSYQIALYSYDSTGSHTTNWTATAPFANTTNDTHFGWNPDSAADLPAGYTFVAAGDFVAPLDEQSITWTAGTTPAPAVLTVTTDGSGNATVYGWGGNGISTNSSGSNGGQNADTTYLDGFQIAVAPVPEPTTLSLIGLSCLGLLRRKSRQS